MPGWLVANDGPLTLALDIEISDELRKEGVARELINRIQNLRKDCGFEVTDKIGVTIFSDSDAKTAIDSALDSFGTYVANQTLAVSVKSAELEEADSSALQVEWEDGTVKAALTIIK